MRRDNATGITERTQEYRAHPVPPKAKACKHIALHFQGSGQRDIVSELCRNLRPSARALLLDPS